MKIVHKFFDLIFDLCFWLLFWSVWIWNRVDGMLATLGLCSDSPLGTEIAQGLIFVILILVMQTLINLPFSMMHTLHNEQKFEQNKITTGKFMCDQIKTFLIQCAIFAALIPMLLWMIQKSYVDEMNRVTLMAVLAGTTITLNMVVNFLVTKLILQLFFEFTELEDEKLKNMIISEGKRCGFTIRDVKVLAGSQRQNYSNVFVSGFCGSRDIIILDSLLENHSNEEILAVVCYEFGLISNCRICSQLIVSSFQLLILFGLFSFCLGNKEILISFGFTHTSTFLYLFLF